MAIINKYPFLNSVLTSFGNDTNLQALKTCINGQGPAPVFRTLKSWGSARLTNDDKGVKPVILELNEPKAQQVLYGYLLFNDTYCVLISYAGEDKQILQMIKIENPTSASATFEYIDESVLITDLRSELNDMLISVGKMIKVQANDIDSGQETAGKALVSNGEGGAAWEALSGGTKLYQHEVLVPSAEEDYPDYFYIITSSNEPLIIENIMGGNKIKIKKNTLISAVSGAGGVQTFTPLLHANAESLDSVYYLLYKFSSTNYEYVNLDEVNLTFGEITEL